MKRTSAIRRRGFSLLEVILSIAILGGSMVVIGYGFFNGYRSVRNAQLVGQANRLADSTMAQLAAGAIEPVSVSSQTFPDENDWSYSVEIQDAEVAGLLSAIVTVENQTATPRINISITRLLIDPDYDPLEEQE